MSSILFTVLGLGAAVMSAQADLVSRFATDSDSWRTIAGGATASWQDSGGNPGGCLRGTGSGSTSVWHFASPAAWGGDWSSFRTLKFDLAIPTRQYPDSDTAAMVVIKGTNGQTMSWQGPTPLWSWTHHEVSLTAASFDADPAVFAGIMASVKEVRLLAEFDADSTETVALDNVVLTTAPPAQYNSNLESRFSGGNAGGWTAVDDVTVTVTDEGRPSFALRGGDWMDGRLWKVASPGSWAGDWSAFREIRFDMKWSGGSPSQAATPLVHVFGANGEVMVANLPVTNGVWQAYTVPLNPEVFGVTRPVFDGIMAHVSKIWLQGELGPGDGNDITLFDNIVVATGPHQPQVFATSLLERFGTNRGGWMGYDYSTAEWDATGGFSGGGLRVTDTGNGDGRVQSPDSWSGDWRAFGQLRLMFKTTATATRAGWDSSVKIVAWNGTYLAATLPSPFGSWTPYTVDLTPATFGVSESEFDAVMRDVACVWITTDVENGYDVTLLDDISLMLAGTPAGAPPRRAASFESTGEGWRLGECDGMLMPITAAPGHSSTEGLPPGSITATDQASYTCWITPESWAGDWRGQQSVSFDLKIIDGTPANLLPAGMMLGICSPHGNLFQACSAPPVPQQWSRYEMPLTAAAFGVSQEQFDLVMRDVVFVAIRSEWINFAELEALDNVLVSGDPYLEWLAGYLTPEQMADPSKSGRDADLDADGSTNWAEYMALTSPTNANQRLELAPPKRTTEGFVISFPTRQGRLYLVRGGDSLENPAAWSVIGAPVLGDGAVHGVTDHTVALRRFYRLEIQLAP